MTANKTKLIVSSILLGVIFTANQLLNAPKYSALRLSDASKSIALKYKRKKVLCSESHYLPTIWNAEKQEFDCNFNINRDTAYLPSRDFLDIAKNNVNEEWRLQQSKYYDTIDAIQFPQSCEINPKSKETYDELWKPSKDEFGNNIRTPGDQWPDKPIKEYGKWHLTRFLAHGYAYNLFVFTLNAMYHWQVEVPIIVGNSKYRYTDFHCGRGYSCLMSPLSNCSITQIPKDQIMIYAQGDHVGTAISLDSTCKPNGYYDMNYGRCVCDKGFIPDIHVNYFYCVPFTAIELNIPRKQAHKDHWESKRSWSTIHAGDSIHFGNVAPGESNPFSMDDWVRSMRHEDQLLDSMGMLWKHSMTLWYLQRNAKKRPMLDKFVQDAGIIPGECIAVHVRHGDSCTDQYQNHRVCKPLKDFMESVQKLVDQYQMNKVVYLATDDPQVVQDTKVYESYTFITQELNRDVFVEASKTGGIDANAEFNDPSAVDGIAADIWAMSHCGALVASFTSSVGWVTYGLMVGRFGYYPPFISTDLPWGDERNAGRFY